MVCHLLHIHILPTVNDIEQTAEGENTQIDIANDYQIQDSYNVMFDSAIDGYLIFVKRIWLFVCPPSMYCKRKRKRSDSVLWQKSLHQQNCQWDKVTAQTMPQKKFDYTAIADRLRTVNLSNYGHLIGVVYRFYRAHLPTHRNSRTRTCKYYSTVTLKL